MTVLEHVAPCDALARAVVADARRGDVAAFAALYEEHHDRVLRLCRGLLGNDDDAADAAQDAFLRAWRALGGMHDDGKFGPWLRTIATNVCMDVLRRRKRTVTVADIDGEVEEEGADLLLLRADVDSLTAALDRLSHRHRDVLWMRECAGWSYERIAADQQLDLSAVKSLLWRARQALRREFLSLTAGGRMAIVGAFLPLRLARRWVGRPMGGASRAAQFAVEAGSSAGAAAVVASTAALPILLGGPAPTGALPPPAPPAVVQVVEEASAPISRAATVVLPATAAGIPPAEEAVAPEVAPDPAPVIAPAPPVAEARTEPATVAPPALETVPDVVVVAIPSASPGKARAPSEEAPGERAEARAEAAEAKADAKSEAKAEAKAEKTEAKAEKHEAKDERSEARAEAKTERAEAKADAKADAKATRP